jgi:hypothetical protein
MNISDMGYKEALDYATSIIMNYESDIKEAGYADEGFCQGVIYRDALKRIEELRRQEDTE